MPAASIFARQLFNASSAPAQPDCSSRVTERNDRTLLATSSTDARAESLNLKAMLALEGLASLFNSLKASCKNWPHLRANRVSACISQRSASGRVLNALLAACSEGGEDKKKAA